MKYKVRTGFVAHLKDDDGSSHTYAEGKIVELTNEQLELYAHQVEPVEPVDQKGAVK